MYIHKLNKIRTRLLSPRSGMEERFHSSLPQADPWMGTVNLGNHLLGGVKRLNVSFQGISTAETYQRPITSRFCPCSRETSLHC